MTHTVRYCQQITMGGFMRIPTMMDFANPQCIKGSVMTNANWFFEKDSPGLELDSLMLFMKIFMCFSF